MFKHCLASLCCVCLVASIVPAMAQPHDGLESIESRASATASDMVAGDRQVEESTNAAHARQPVRRYLRHFLAGDAVEADDLPLWLLAAAGDLPDRVEAEVEAIREMREALSRVSTYRSDDIEISVALARPSWRIIIPIR